MLDPITAIGLASSIATFVDLASRLVVTTSELSRSADGVLSAHRELETVASHTRELSKKLRTDRPQNQSIQDLAQMQNRAATELLSLLQDLKVRDRRRCFDVVLPAVRSIRKGPRIKSIQEEITRLQQALSVHMLAEAKYAPDFVLTSKENADISTFEVIHNLICLFLCGKLHMTPRKRWKGSEKKYSKQYKHQNHTVLIPRFLNVFRCG